MLLPHSFSPFVLFLLLLFPLHFAIPVPALPAHSSALQSQFKPGQIFSGDQLPPELQKAPIVQANGAGGHSSASAAVSFSGYSFDYSPADQQQAKAGGQKAASSASPSDRLSGNAAGYDQLAAPSPPTPSPAPNRDAFLLRPSPSEQFLSVLPPPSLPAKSPSDLAKFLPPADSQKPKLTGWVVGIHEPPPEQRLRQPFPGGQAIVNPAAYFMEGADLSRIRPPRCSLIGCKGPVPNDFDFHLEQEEMPMDTMEAMDRSCHPTFVPLNGCMDGRGYPIGMICSICCECTAELVGEMRKSRGWIQGYRHKQL